jgi:SAM-dependent methyltransferase
VVRKSDGPGGGRSYAPPVIFQHPLAYLLGLEGVALLRAFAGEHDRDFVRDRFVEVRELLDSADLFGDGVEIPPISATQGYAAWAPRYDEPGNALFDIEGPIVREIIDGLPSGVALDAACGTGRHTEHLVARGYSVIAIDNSPDMLGRARINAPQATFHEADFHHIPLPDGHVDLVVCALALTHVPDLADVFAEFVRVLRPGGHLVTSDAAGLAAGLRPPVTMTTAHGVTGTLPHYNRTTGDYLRSALTLGLQVRRCEEPRRSGPAVDPSIRPTPEQMLVDGPPNIWWLHHWFPVATNAAFADVPGALIWHFQRPER